MAGDSLIKFLRRLRWAAGRDAEPCDADLVGRYAVGRDEAAFAELVRRHGPMVLGVCRRVLPVEADAEDAFQATFLVLARRAAAVRRPAAVGNWLYGVAYNVARRAKTMNHRRATHERAAARVAAVEPDPWHPVDSAVDDELNRLPDKYRAAVVACGLEGRTIREAADALGWPAGTVATRLARGRALLASRLARRGVVVPATVLALGESVMLSPDLVAATVRAAELYAAGRAVAGRAAALADAVLGAMARGKALIMAAVALGFGLTGGGVGVLALRAADPPPVAEKKNPPPAAPAETADQRARRIALRAHDRAAAFDKLPRFDYQVEHRHGVVDSLRAVDNTLDVLKRGLTPPVHKADWIGWYELGFSWDKTRCLWERRPGKTDFNRSAMFGTATDAWDRSASNDQSRCQYVRRAGVAKFWENVNHFDYSYLRLTPHRYWWGQTTGKRQDTMSVLPPNRVKWRPLGIEPFGDEKCDVVDSPERGQRLWIGQTSGHVRGVLTYQLNSPDRGARYKTFFKSDEVRRIAGRPFATSQEYETWHETMTVDQRIRLSLAWHALNPPGPKDVFVPNDLVRFDGYREVAPGVWLPFHETRTCCYGSETAKGKWQVDRAELRVVSVRTDRDLADACARLMPKEGDPVQDQRFAVAVDFKYKADRTDAEVRRTADAEYQKRLKDQELVKRLLEPIAALVGKPAPALPADGWVGGKRPDVAGKPYLVRFWAEWCGPCKDDLPLLKRLAEQGVIVVGMHPPGTPAETVAAAVQEHKSPWPTFVAQGKSGGGGPVAIGGYRVGAFPYYVLVDAKGRVAGHGFLPALLKQFGAAAMIPPTKTPSSPK